MSKKYQVFVSSTYNDLQEERRGVMEALLSNDCIPTGMELFSASDETQWDYIKSVIDDCDYYLLIVGGRYGSMDENGVSFTEKEYRYALEKDKPIISFLPKNPGAIPRDKCANTDDEKRKLENFSKFVSTDKLIKHWSNADDLKYQVSGSLQHLKISRPSVGWVKGDQVASTEILQENLKLQKEVKDLKIKLKKVSFEKPEFTENLQQGGDSFEINYSYEVYDENTSLVVGHPSQRRIEDTISMTWDEIFCILAPHLLGKETEFNLLPHLYRDIMIQKRYADHTIERSIRVRDRDFQRIKIQLLALGLIEIESIADPQYGSVIYLKLTSYGNNYMFQKLALKNK